MKKSVSVPASSFLSEHQVNIIRLVNTIAMIIVPINILLGPFLAWITSGRIYTIPERPEADFNESEQESLP